MDTGNQILMKAEKIGKMFDQSAKTVIRWAQAGCPHFHPGKNYLFDPADVREWLMQNHSQNYNVIPIQQRRTA